MKKLLTLFVALILTLSCAAFAESDSKTIVIGATPSPHAEVLELIKDDMAALGYPIEIKIFTDYNLPNAAVASGELDANYFAHIPFINAYNASVGEDQQVVPVIGVHYEPFGIYSSKYTSLDELPGERDRLHPERSVQPDPRAVPASGRRSDHPAGRLHSAGFSESDRRG